MGEFPHRFGKYLLLRRVAVGGMAEVLLAVELTPHGGHRFVTIKRIRREFCGEDDYVEFFLTEGRVSLKCAHPNLPQTFDLGVQDGTHYLAMEFIQGHTLLDAIRAAALKHKPLAVGSAMRVGVGVAAALEHAHGLVDVDGKPLGIIHRDVTPQNIMITAAGAVKLIDFGIVRAAVQTHETQVGVVKGKFSYMAPEMLRGAPRSLDHRADLFALGIVLHETLTGRSLFRGRNDEETLERVRSLPIPSLSELRPDVPRALEAVVMRALERDPDRRFQSATELLHALEEAAENEGIFSSMTRLRDEVLDRCGLPAAPAIDPTARAMLELPVRDRAARVASPPPIEESSAAIPIDTGDVWIEPAFEPDPSAEIAAFDPAPAAPLAEPSPATPAPTSTPVERTRDPRASDVRLAHLERDPQLLYYLRRAGALAGPTRAAGSTHADHDLSELLASLDH